MNKLVAMVVVAMLVLAGSALGQTTFSVDFQGPTAGGGAPGGIPDGFWGFPINEGQILTVTPPGPPGPNPPLLGPPPLPPPGIMVDSWPFSPIGSVWGGLGILPGVFGQVELDALSYGRDVPPFRQQTFLPSVFFSVDEFAVGIPGTPAPPAVWTEGALGPAFEAAADVFVYLGPWGPIAPGPIFGNTGFSDGNGLPSATGLVYPGVGLIEPNFPTPGVLPDFGDNLDAVDVDTTLEDVTGPIYFSLDSAFPDPLEPSPPTNSGTAVANLFVGGDVLVTTAGAFPPVVYAPAIALGLDLVPGFGPDSDDLDALALLESGDGIFTPGEDLIYFSVRRGSALVAAGAAGLAVDSRFGLPIEPGDILDPPVPGGLSPFPGIWIAAEAMGLWTVRSFGPSEFGPFGDDLDALDVVPEPGTVAMLIGAGLIGLAAYARRRRKS